MRSPHPPTRTHLANGGVPFWRCGAQRWYHRRKPDLTRMRRESSQRLNQEALHLAYCVQHCRCLVVCAPSAEKTRLGALDARTLSNSDAKKDTTRLAFTNGGPRHIDIIDR